MRTGTRAGMTCVLVVLTATWAGAATPTPAPDVAKLVEGNNAFALDLYAKIANQPGNLFLSPYSISTALGMTYAGARGQTQLQMAKVLHFDLPEPRVNGAFGKVIADLNALGKKGEFELSVANALWGQQGYRFLPDYLQVVEKNYGGKLQEVNFRTATEEARKTVNAWVEKETHDRIKDLIKQGMLDPMTRLVLTNAIYFKGKWETEFKKEQTKEEPFILANRRPSVSMMHQTNDFGYMEGADFQVLEMPYKGQDLSMVVFLPRKPDGLPAFEKRLSGKNVTEWLGKLRRQEVVVSFPKFTMTSEFGLGEVLMSLGMTDAFSGQADFSGMTGGRDLFISAVVHKAFVDVNEEGTEAAAATGVIMKLTAVATDAPPVFKADHPFFFLIRERQSGGILFMGRVAEPSKSN